MKRFWTPIKILFQPQPADPRIRLFHGIIAGLCGVLLFGVSTRLSWSDDRFVYAIGGGSCLLCTSLMRFIPRYAAQLAALRSIVAASALLVVVSLPLLYHR